MGELPKRRSIGQALPGGCRPGQIPAICLLFPLFSIKMGIRSGFFRKTPVLKTTQPDKRNSFASADLSGCVLDFITLYEIGFLVPLPDKASGWICDHPCVAPFGTEKHPICSDGQDPGPTNGVQFGCMGVIPASFWEEALSGTEPWLVPFFLRQGPSWPGPWGAGQWAFLFWGAQPGSSIWGRSR